MRRFEGPFGPWELLGWLEGGRRVENGGCDENNCSSYNLSRARPARI